MIVAAEVDEYVEANVDLYRHHVGLNFSTNQDRALISTVGTSTKITVDATLNRSPIYI
jgi:hypothetical protein